MFRYSKPFAEAEYLICDNWKISGQAASEYKLSVMWFYIYPDQCLIQEPVKIR